MEVISRIRTGGPLPDRYFYDFRVCTVSKGWAQIDIGQDASYFGQWVNPSKRLIFCYCEGDTVLTRCQSDSELQGELARIKAWNVENGHRFIGIDPGFSEELKTALVSAGLGQYL